LYTYLYQVQVGRFSRNRFFQLIPALALRGMLMVFHGLISGPSRLPIRMILQKRVMLADRDNLSEDWNLMDHGDEHGMVLTDN